MKIFLDANVLISVLNKEYPVFTYASRVLSLTGRKNVELFTSPVCLAIAFYFAEKKSGTTKAKEKIALLVSKISIADTGKRAVHATLRNKSVNDFEDGLEYYSALQAGCTHFVTEDKSDFYFAEIPVTNSEEFLKKHFMP